MNRDPSQKAKKVRLLIQKGKGFLERGQPEEAVKVFRQILAIEPEHPQVQRWLERLQGSTDRSGRDAERKAARRGPKVRERVAAPPKASGSGARRSPKDAASPSRPDSSPGPEPGHRRQRTPPAGGGGLDLEDPDVAALLSGSARSSLLHRYRAQALTLLAIVVAAVCLVWFYRHSSSFRVRLGQDSTHLVIQKGRFFFGGWDRPGKVAVGYHAGWMERLARPELLEELREGRVFPSGQALERFLIQLFQRLGDETMDTQDPELLLEAVYYYKQAHKILARMTESERRSIPEMSAVRDALVATLLRLAEHHAIRGETRQARDALEEALKLAPGNREARERLAAMRSGA